MAAKGKYFAVVTYANFKAYVKLLGSDPVIVYAYSMGNYHWAMGASSISGFTVWFNDSSLNTATLLTDFPSAISTASNSSSALNSNHQFLSYDYTEFKNVVAALNLGGPILWGFDGGSNFAIAAYGSDGSWEIKFQGSSVPGSLGADFPTAVQIDYPLITPL